jgi:hypothetical protein
VRAQLERETANTAALEAQLAVLQRQRREEERRAQQRLREMEAELERARHEAATAQARVVRVYKSSSCNIL